jgi:UrcA family protein
MYRFLKMKFAILCAVASILASPLSALASAVGQPDNPPQRVVSYADLDLNRSSGVKTLYSRINVAAREVCDPLDVWALKLLRQKQDCRQAAIAKAVADVNSAALTSYYLTRNKAAVLNTQQ